jgi:hypothetical protein
MRYAGQCHCGNIEVAFVPTRPASELQLRDCACSFCRRHGATGVSDPAGKLEIALRAPADVSRYRFGLRTADFLVCRTCGVYVAAVCVIENVTYAVLNANVLEERSAFTRSLERADFDGETSAERMTRRGRTWTPASFHDASRPR